MKKKVKSLRTPLARAKGLGSARAGAHHWWLQRLTSLALVPLSIYVVYDFFVTAVYGGYEGATTWLNSPFAAVLLILFIGFAFHHAASGLQVVIEDYVHCESLKTASILAIKFFALALAVLAILAVVKILFFTIIIGMLEHAGHAH